MAKAPLSLAPKANRLAMDRGTARSVDVDGRLHVQDCPISKATVNPYYGWEIPNYEELGLDPRQVYKMLRDPEELKRGAATFNNIQLLDTHDPVEAGDPKQEIVVGTTGTDTRFDGEFLRTTLTVWTQEAIDEIESGEKRELSSSYRYDAVMEPGTFQGLRYDGRMVNIIANHVALVEKGRAGPDVMVSDGFPKGLRMKKSQFLNFVASATTLFAKDADINPDELVNLIAAAAAAQGGEGEGAEDDELNADPNAMDGLPAAAMEFLKGKLSDEDFAELAQHLGGAEDEGGEEDEGEDGEDGEEAEGEEGTDRANDRAPRALRAKPRRAMDAAAIRTQAVRDVANYQRACDKVRPFIGTVKVAMDSPAAASRLYRLALDAAGVKHTGIKGVAALEAMVDLLPKPGATPFAADAASGATDPLDAALAGAGRIVRS